MYSTHVRQYRLFYGELEQNCRSGAFSYKVYIWASERAVKCCCPFLGCLQLLCCLWYSVHRCREKLLYFKIFRSTWAPRLCEKNAFEECQACLKYLLLLLEDAAEKTPFMWRQRFQLKATFCHSFASWWSLSVYPALSFSVLFSLFFFLPPPSVFFSVSADWQIEVEVSPSPPGPATHCDSPPPSSRRVSLLIWQGYLRAIAFEKPSTMTQKWTPPAVQGVKEDALKRMPENFLIKLEASTQWSVACQQCTP